MTGYKPHVDWFKRLGVKWDDEKNQPEVNNDTLETNVEGLYMAGVIVSGMQTSKLFIENTRDHGATILQNITQNQES